MTEVRGQPQTTHQYLVHFLKAIEKTVGNALYHNGLQSHSAHKVPLLKKAHVQVRLKFTNEHLHDSEKGVSAVK